MSVLFLKEEPNIGQSISDAENKGYMAADNFNTIIKPTQSLSTLYYCHTLVFVNNVMIKYFPVLGQTSVSLLCSNVISIVRKRDTFCYSLTLSLLSSPFQG